MFALIAFFYYPTLDNAGAGVDLYQIERSKVEDLSDLMWLLGGPSFIPKGAEPELSDPFAFSQYRPIALLYLSVLERLFGSQILGYRLANLLVFYVSTLLVYLLVYRISQDAVVSLLTGILFAIDPLRAYFIFVITGSSHGGLVLLFYLLAILLYWSSRLSTSLEHRRVSFLLSILCGFLAVFAYEPAVSLPLVIVVVEWFGGIVRKSWKPAFHSIWPYVGIVVLFFVLKSLSSARANLFLVPLTPTMLGHVAYLIIQSGTRLIMLFIPNFHDLRRAMRNQVFGHIPGYEIVSAHTGLFIGLAIMVGFMVVAMGWWIFRQQAIRTYLWRNDHGRLIVFGAGWLLAAVIPLFFHYYPATRHLLMAAVGADLIKAVLVVSVARYLHRALSLRRGPAYVVPATVLVLYNFFVFSPSLKQYETCDHQGKNILHQSETLLARRGVEGKQTVVYYLNVFGGISDEDCQVTSGLESSLQRALGRQDVRIVLPYSLSHENLDAYQRAIYPEVRVAGRGTVVVTSRDQNIFSQRVVLHPTSLGYDAVDVLEVGEPDKRLVKFQLRFQPLSNTHQVFLAYDKAQLVLLRGLFE